MEKRPDKNLGKEIMPRDLFEHYVEARKNTYASGKKPQMDLHIPDFWGYDYHEDGSPYYYQDNYIDNKNRPGYFSGTERVSMYGFGEPPLVTYRYHGGLTKEGLKEGEDYIYSRLTRFLQDHVQEVRFGENVRFSFDDKEGKWEYEGEGLISELGWEDRERIVHNGKQVYELEGVGMFLE